MNDTQIKNARELQNKGLSIQEIAYRLGINIDEIDAVLLSKSCINANGLLIIN